MPNFVTIKDIAKALNISVSTVSRALRNTFDVSQETRKKVQDMAAALKYKPNFNATGLANGSTHNIGIVIPFITNYYFSTVITGIQETAYKNGYNIILFVTNDSPDREKSILQDLTLSSLDGLLISTCCDDCSALEDLQQANMPIVFFDRVNDQLKVSKVMQDDYNGAYQATSHLIEEGYTKIAHLGGPKGQAFSERRLSGYLDALKRHCLPIQNEWMQHTGFSQEQGEQDMETLLSLPSRPNAVFAINDRKAIGACVTLKKKGLLIGEQIGVIGFTNDPTSSLISPSLSTIAEPAFEIGRLSCELLLKHIQKKNLTPTELVLPGKLIIRDSTKRKKRKESLLPLVNLPSTPFFP